ncbi:UDP-N-acetylglucosamine--undecaprenyl-phosphate N-acetylglucosaminephosphotransferase [Vibrio methylphosphonaticus]|uniref:UDP-N-acetylglucosamine--undecaprenyl-phosphate N-acetylglucosaminephosphotransferase n=1 Tax=Vibrio methylphosphonaticus TaxID=2946866 RepID=UPI00202AB6BF|nr:UDP-N-acetylglucosamine--undecaprenyl-phosphate N-acetylglucosaminephosphotransferase [Vibrio methylphosphonaticus]MCL9775512.1 UDP-N-acetylglucosamine--undecaprenyl-phosphate N-acetylglucosaminephosphotransferase [Vibrio methylphosphonaticus]
MISTLGFVFITAFITLFFARRLAKMIGLVDKPNARKHHQGVVPLVGGIAICTTVTLTVLLFNVPIEHAQLFLFSICALTVLGALDDKYDISFKARMLCQALLSLAMMHFADLELHTLGDMFGLGHTELGGFAVLITVLGVIGAINAFNMVDGIDGLLGGLAIVSFSALAFLLYQERHHELGLLCLIFIVAAIPYIGMNLGLLGRERKVFMGDAGSMMIGFTVIWLLLSSSQGETGTIMRPVTALWLIALPLMDMAAIMIRRVRRGDSPFKPDREHLHHICQRLGLSSRQTLLVICSLASLLTGFGIYGEMVQIPEPIMFYGFIVCFIAYALCLSHIFKVTRFIRKKLGKPEAPEFAESK